MSLYNALFGVNPMAPLLKAILELDEDREGLVEFPDVGYDTDTPEVEKWVDEAKRLNYYPTGRFRDIYLDDDLIVLYTRNGGGNADWLWYVHSCLRQHPHYLSEEDDDFDSTYRYYYFIIPPMFQRAIEEVRGLGEQASPRDKWDTLFVQLEEGNAPEHVLEVGREIVQRIHEAISKPE